MTPPDRFTRGGGDPFPRSCQDCDVTDATFPTREYGGVPLCATCAELRAMREPAQSPAVTPRLEPDATDPPVEPPPESAPPPSRRVRRIELTPASQIRSERVLWAWRRRIPAGGVTVVAGEKGLGKSVLTNAALVAGLTRGSLVGDFEGRAMDALIASAEDGWEAVIKPRLVVHGANLDRVHRVRAVDESGHSLLTLPDDVAELEGTIEALRADGQPVGMLVIDPIGAFLSDRTDSHRDASVRRALAPLASMAERLDLAVVVVAHLSKDESQRLINRVTGSGAFVNAARSVLVFARDPDDPEGEQSNDRVLVHVASNWGAYAPSLAATVEARSVRLDDGDEGEVGHLVIKGETHVRIEDVQAGDSRSDCEAAISRVLSAGPRKSRDVKAVISAELECSERTVERAAKRMERCDELFIESGGYPRTTTWSLIGRDVSTGPVPTADGSPLAATDPDSQAVATNKTGIATEKAGGSSDRSGSADLLRERRPRAKPADEEAVEPAQQTLAGWEGRL